MVLRSSSFLLQNIRRTYDDFAVGERLGHAPNSTQTSYQILKTWSSDTYMSIGGEKRATKPTQYAARRARKSSQYISCAVEVVNSLHFRHISVQREDCISKLPVFAASLFFIHIFVFRISKKTVLGRMRTVSAVFKNNLASHHGLLLEVPEDTTIPPYEQALHGVYINQPAALS